MTVAKPLCVTCHRRHREPGSARCCDCGAGRIHGTAPPPRRRPRPTPAERLGGDTGDTETPPANTGPTPTAEAP